MTQEKYYVFNLETTKIELHFDKAEYDTLPEDKKQNLKSAFLFSGKGKCWVSRAKEPNLYRAKQVAKALGFAEEVREGERLSFAEQLEKKAERAEERAERYEQYAGNAESRAASMQKPLKDKRGDIAFFTQPNIAGRTAFKNYRERLFARYEKGFEEYRKSAYFRERAETAKDTAKMEKLKDKGYLNRRVEENRKTIRDRTKNIERYEQILEEMEAGQKKKRYDGTPVTIDEINQCLLRELELIEVAQDKEGFFLNCLDDLGGIAFSRDNIKVGYIVTVKTFGAVEVTGRGSKNIIYKILTGGAAGMVSKAAYAEIEKIVRAEEKVKKK